LGGGGMASEFYGIAAIEAFKELGDGVWDHEARLGRFHL
jgi:hypothetical protein